MRSSPPGWPEFFLVWGGVIGLILTVLGSHSPWIPLPYWWLRQRFLFEFLFTTGIILGVLRWAAASSARLRWKPTRPGRRFGQIIVYSKDDCPLCDEAIEFLHDYPQFYRELSVVGIEQSPELTDAYKLSVPVIEIDGKVRFKGCIHPLLFHRLIEGTPPRIKNG